MRQNAFSAQSWPGIPERGSPLEDREPETLDGHCLQDSPIPFIVQIQFLLKSAINGTAFQQHDHSPPLCCAVEVMAIVIRTGFEPVSQTQYILAKSQKEMPDKKSEYKCLLAVVSLLRCFPQVVPSNNPVCVQRLPLLTTESDK